MVLPPCALQLLELPSHHPFGTTARLVILTATKQSNRRGSGRWGRSEKGSYCIFPIPQTSAILKILCCTEKPRRLKHTGLRLLKPGRHAGICQASAHEAPGFPD